MADMSRAADRRADRAGSAGRRQGSRLAGPRRPGWRPRLDRQGRGRGDVRRLATAAGGGPGDLVLIVADADIHAQEALGSLRVKLADRLGAYDRSLLSYVWVHHFPMYQWDEEHRRWDATHNPFSGVHARGRGAPGDDLRRPAAWPARTTRPAAPALSSTTSPSTAGSWAAAPCASTRARCSRARSRCRATRLEAQEAKFSGILEAFEYGAPPHGGIALGVDRWIALLTDQVNIREVMAFPKTSSGSDLMLDAPSPVEPGQLEELGSHAASARPRRGVARRQPRARAAPPGRASRRQPHPTRGVARRPARAGPRSRAARPARLRARARSPGRPAPAGPALPWTGMPPGPGRQPSQDVSMRAAGRSTGQPAWPARRGRMTRSGARPWASMSEVTVSGSIQVMRPGQRSRALVSRDGIGGGRGLRRRTPPHRPGRAGSTRWAGEPCRAAETEPPAASSSVSSSTTTMMGRAPPAQAASTMRRTAMRPPASIERLLHARPPRRPRRRSSPACRADVAGSSSSSRFHSGGAAHAHGDFCALGSIEVGSSMPPGSAPGGPSSAGAGALPARAAWSSRSVGIEAPVAPASDPEGPGPLSGAIRAAGSLLDPTCRVRGLAVLVVGDEVGDVGWTTARPAIGAERRSAFNARGRGRARRARGGEERRRARRSWAAWAGTAGPGPRPPSWSGRRAAPSVPGRGF